MEGHTQGHLSTEPVPFPSLGSSLSQLGLRMGPSPVEGPWEARQSLSWAPEGELDQWHLGLAQTESRGQLVALPTLRCTWD